MLRLIERKGGLIIQIIHIRRSESEFVGFEGRLKRSELIFNASHLLENLRVHVVG